MSVIYQTTFYDKDGHVVGGGQGYMPDYLDWMPMAAKAFWFRFMGIGNPQAEYVLLKSQGEQRLLIGVTLVETDLKQYQEKNDGAEHAVQDYIDRQGISRTPRNQ